MIFSGAGHSHSHDQSNILPTNVIDSYWVMSPTFGIQGGVSGFIEEPVSEEPVSLEEKTASIVHDLEIQEDGLHEHTVIITEAGTIEINAPYIQLLMCKKD